MTKKKEKSLAHLISPENRMLTADMTKLNLNHPEGAVLNMIEKVEMPLYIYGIPCSFMGLECHFMAAIQHFIKENIIEIRGRLRFESSGNKTSVTGKNKMQYSKENLETMKQEIKDIVRRMGTIMPFITTKTPFELNFEVDESIESIMKKMNNSNQFDIGVKDKEPLQIKPPK